MDDFLQGGKDGWGVTLTLTGYKCIFLENLIYFDRHDEKTLLPISYSGVLKVRKGVK